MESQPSAIQLAERHGLIEELRNTRKQAMVHRQLAWMIELAKLDGVASVHRYAETQDHKAIALAYRFWESGADVRTDGKGSIWITWPSEPDGVDKFREVGFSENPHLTDEAKAELAQSHLEAQKQPEAAKKAGLGQPEAPSSLTRTTVVPNLVNLGAPMDELREADAHMVALGAKFKPQKPPIETALRTKGTDPDRPEPVLLRLNPRQLEVLAIIASGGSYVDVSERLDISRHTARAHLAIIRAGLRAKTLAQCVALAMRSGQLR